MRIAVGMGVGMQQRAGTPVAGPVNTVAPANTGANVFIGTTRTCSTGTWTGTGTITYAYQWQRNGVAISGATANTYTLAAADDETSVLCVVTATDDEGARTAASNAISVTYAAPVAAGAIADQSWPEDTAITPLDVSADFTGSDITYALAPSSAALPAGLSLSSAGVISGTPTTVAAQVNIVVRGTNSGGFADTAFGVTIAAAASITIDTLTYTRGAAGVAPDVATTVSSTGTTTGDYTLWGVVAATAQTKAQIDASPDKFSITAAALADLDGSIDLDNSVTDGVLSTYITDSSGSPVISAVVTETGVTYDSVAPAFASAEIGNVDATSLIVTFSKATYGSTSASDWDVQVNGSPATESAVAFTPGGTTADITLGAAVVNGNTVTVAYNGTGLIGVDAEVVATFTAQSVTNNVAAAGFTPQWMQFDGSAWLERNSDLVDIPASATQYIAALTYSPDAAETGVQVALFSGMTSVNKMLDVTKGSTQKMDVKTEDDADFLTYRTQPTVNVVAGDKYLILISVDTVTNGMDMVMIDLADGSVHDAKADTDTGVTLAPPSAGWVIGAASGSGVNAIDGQMERFMLWIGDYADVSLTATQEFFHTGGVLKDPADAVTSIGSTPIVNISGSALATGTNSGSGGNFTKDGAGSITEV